MDHRKKGGSVQQRGNGLAGVAFARIVTGQDRYSDTAGTPTTAGAPPFLIFRSLGGLAIFLGGDAPFLGGGVSL